MKNDAGRGRSSAEAQSGEQRRGMRNDLRRTCFLVGFQNVSKWLDVPSEKEREKKDKSAKCSSAGIALGDWQLRLAPRADVVTVD